MQTNGSAAPPKPKAKASKKASDTHTIDLEETFYARAQDIYECFTQSGKIQAFTQSPAEAQPNVGGSFSMFGGSVQGSYRELQPFTKLILDWRFGNWPDDCKSQVGPVAHPCAQQSTAVKDSLYKTANCLAVPGLLCRVAEPDQS